MRHITGNMALNLPNAVEIDQHAIQVELKHLRALMRKRTCSQCLSRQRIHVDHWAIRAFSFNGWGRIERIQGVNVVLYGSCLAGHRESVASAM